MKNFKNYLLLAAFLVLLVGCKKDLSRTNNISVASKAVASPGNTFFNWETATVMPCAPGVNPNLVPAMPWSTQSGSPVDPGFLNDISSSDGWVLVYNTFNNTTLPYPPLPAGGLYFALYNKYRGLLRYYLYIPQGFMTNSVNIQHGLSVVSGSGQNTSMLNFEGTDMVDANSRAQGFSKTNNVGVAFGGGWYGMQYEIAYDPNFANTSNLWLQWTSKAINISTITVSGTTTGTITGAITQQVPPASLQSILAQGLTIGGEIYSMASVTAPDKTIKLIKALLDGGQKMLGGQIDGILSGIAGGSHTNTQAVDLKMNGTINMTGSINSQTPLFPNTFNVPGQISTQGIAPSQGGALYSSPLGVFNLASRPNVNANYFLGLGWSADGRRQINVASTKFIWTPPAVIVNPAVTANANVSVIKTDLIIYNPYYGTNIFNKFTGGVDETIGEKKARTNPTSFIGLAPLSFATTATLTPTSQNVVAIRITVKVTPNNGAPPSTIVKTFLANVIQG